MLGWKEDTRPCSNESLRSLESAAADLALQGTGIRVSDIAVWHEQMGLSPDEIVADYPGLTLADVHTALAYYYDHIVEIRDQIRADAQLIATAKQGHSSLLATRLSEMKLTS